jgi:ArsR family transcriptional regulator
LPELKQGFSLTRQEDTMATLADMLKIVGDENRLRILSLLRGGELCVCKIFDSLELSQSLVSHHLAILRSCNLVNDRKEGRWVYYSLNKKALEDFNVLHQAVFGVEGIVTGKADVEPCS